MSLRGWGTAPSYLNHLPGGLLQALWIVWNLDRLNGKGTEDELRSVRALLETEAGKLEIPSWEKSPAEELAVSGAALGHRQGKSLAPRKQDVSLPAGGLF